MIKKLLTILLLLQVTVVSAVTLQKDKDAEVVASINDSKAGNLYGSWLFHGGFTDVSFSGINPDYRIASGDTLLVQLWGGLEYQQEIVVDPKLCLQ